MREEITISDHKSALVPLESWAYNSPELKAHGTQIDVGLFAESLIYYDSVLLNVTNQPHLADFIRWAAAQQSVDDLLALLENGEVSLYDYSFASVAAKTGDTYTLLNIQDKIQAKPGTFHARFIDHATVSEVLKPLKQSTRLGQALSEHVIEVKADEFGSAISNAEMDFENPERVARVVQSFLQEVYDFRDLGAVPDVTAHVSSSKDGTRQKITYDVDFDELSAIAGKELNFSRATPLTAGAHANRFLWSSASQNCDLFLGSPISTLVGDKLQESSHHQPAARSSVKTAFTVERLKEEVEFPDVRRLVNAGQMTLAEVLKIRSKASRFREWLQEGAERDRNAIIAYHQEVATESGFTRVGRRTLSAFGAVGSPVGGAGVGLLIGGVPGALVGAAAGGAIGYLVNLGARMGADWRPVVFGKWLETRVRKLDK